LIHFHLLFLLSRRHVGTPFAGISFSRTSLNHFVDTFVISRFAPFASKHSLLPFGSNRLITKGSTKGAGVERLPDMVVVVVVVVVVDVDG
jgi:hypothetical protein